MEYHYIAYDGRGQQLKGTVQASSPALASAQLKQSGLFPVAISNEFMQRIRDERCHVRRRPIAKFIGGCIFKRWLRAVGESICRGSAKTAYEGVCLINRRWRLLRLLHTLDTIEDGLLMGESFSLLLAWSGLLEQKEVDQIQTAEADGRLAEALCGCSPEPPPARVFAADAPAEPDLILLRPEYPIHSLLALILQDVCDRKADKLVLGYNQAGAPYVHAMSGDQIVSRESPPAFIIPQLRRMLLTFARIPYWAKCETQGRIHHRQLHGDWDVTLLADGTIQAVPDGGLPAR